VFTMMVIMALVTTFMTSPLLTLINWLFPEKKPAVQPTHLESQTSL